MSSCCEHDDIIENCEECQEETHCQMCSMTNVPLHIFDETPQGFMLCIDCYRDHDESACRKCGSMEFRISSCCRTCQECSNFCTECHICPCCTNSNEEWILQYDCDCFEWWLKHRVPSHDLKTEDISQKNAKLLEDYKKKVMVLSTGRLPDEIKKNGCKKILINSCNMCHGNFFAIHIFGRWRR